MFVVPLLTFSLATLPLDGKTTLPRRQVLAQHSKISLKRPADPPPQPSASAMLLAYYSNRQNYARVTASVFRWYGTRRNGCVAFMSEALRQSGYHVPLHEVLWGENVSLQVWGFARFLESKKWLKIDNPKLVVAGDIIFTHGTPQKPSRPAHVYLFAGWKDESRGTGWAIDNQGFTHKRNVHGRKDAFYTPMRFAYRAPKI